VVVPASFNRASILSFLESVQQMLERLASRLEEDARKADAAAALIERIRRWLKGLPELTPRPRPPMRTPDSERLLRAEAKAGITLAIELAADGSADVRVNGRDPFHLSPALASLLTLLAAPSDLSGPGCAPWSTKDELAAALSRELGRAVVPARVTSLVHRLRKTMSDAGENPFVVETSRRRGAWRVVVRGDRP
jgi:hypothetical protein